MPEIIVQILEVCLIPLLGVLTSFLIKFINSKANELKAKTANETAQKYIQMAADTVTMCVVATNQTYVESLKKQGSFDEIAQQIAFKETYEAVLQLLPGEAMKYLTEAFGDGKNYLTALIEKTVNENK